MPTEQPKTNLVVQEDKTSDLVLAIEDNAITSDETKISEEKTFQPNVFLATYNRHPSCVQLNINTSYTLTNTVTGNNYCYYFPVPSPSSVKVEAFVNSQQSGENHNLTLTQDDPFNPYTFPSTAVSSNSGNADERALMVSDDGHYYIILTAATSTGQAVNFGLNVYTDFDDQELSETVGSAHTVSHGETLTGNIDSAADIDFINYTAAGSHLAVKIKQTTNIHEFLYSLNNGSSWFSVTGSGILGLDVTPGDTILFAFRRHVNLNVNQDYQFSVWDERNLMLKDLSGKIENSVDNSGNYHYKTIPGYLYQGYPIRGGSTSYNSFFRLFGQLTLQDNSAAAYRKFTIDWTTATATVGGKFFEQEVYTDENGHFEFFIPLRHCKGGFTHLKKVSGLNPDQWFKFDRDTYHIRGETVNGDTVLNTDNEHYFNICEVRENGPGGSMLNLFTYD